LLSNIKLSTERMGREGLMRKALVFLAVALVAGAGGVWLGRHWSAGGGQAPDGAARVREAQPEPAEPIRITGPDRLELSAEVKKTLGVRVEPASAAPSKNTLTLTGSLFIDSNRLAYVHSRFTGEVTEIGRVPAQPDDPDATTDPATGKSTRPLRVGDRVSDGQILAVVWSKEIGEKKSDLVEALSRMHSSKARLERLEGLSKGTVAAQVVFDARRQYDSDIIEVERAERTLRSWKETGEEIAEVYREADRIEKGQPRAADGRLERTWANVEVRAPFAGVILEKNVTVGEIAETTDNLFKVAHLSRMGVLANVYEEDLPRLLALPPEQRTWKIRLKAEPDVPPIDGKFEVVGNVIDPSQHTAAVIGWIENPGYKLRVGQFITATVELPDHEDVVAVPNSSVIDVGTAAYVFVADGPDVRTVTMRRVEVVRRGRELALIRRGPRDVAPAGTESVSAGPTGSVGVGEWVVAAGNLELFGALQNASVADNDAGEAEEDGTLGGGQDAPRDGPERESAALGSPAWLRRPGVVAAFGATR
jgi:cobalt-zinc-cadmium efflux system membrane fusion protein